MTQRNWRKILFGASARDLAGRVLLLFAAIITSLVIVFIFLDVWAEALPAILILGPALFGTTWDPTGTQQYGILVFIVGTLWVTGLSLLIAIPLGIAGSLFLAEYAPNRLKEPLRIIMILMAGIPSIIYGLWGLYTLIPFLRGWLGSLPGLDWYTGFGILPASIVLAIMLLPTIVSISYNSMVMVPDTLREASYALGASRTETSIKVVLSTALPGVSAAVLLSLGRAVGETMAVLLLTGNNSARIPMSILDLAYVMTSVIANQLGLAVGGFPLMQSSLFFIALMLLVLAMFFSFTAKVIVRWGMRKQGLR